MGGVGSGRPFVAGGRLGRNLERLARPVGRCQAQPLLLVEGQRRVIAERGTSMLAGRARPAPGSPLGQEQWAQLVRRRSAVDRRGRRPWSGSRPARCRIRRWAVDHAESIPSRIGPDPVNVRSAPDPRTRKNPGDDLFSRKAALSVSSALESLTSVFGMGTGVASPLESPGFVASGRVSAGGSPRSSRKASRRGAPNEGLRSRGVVRDRYHAIHSH